MARPTRAARAIGSEVPAQAFVMKTMVPLRSRRLGVSASEGGSRQPLPEPHESLRYLVAALAALCLRASAFAAPHHLSLREAVHNVDRHKTRTPGATGFLPPERRRPVPRFC
jgi:hypothetical protein